MYIIPEICFLTAPLKLGDYPPENDFCQPTFIKQSTGVDNHAYTQDEIVQGMMIDCTAPSPKHRCTTHKLKEVEELKRKEVEVDKKFRSKKDKVSDWWGNASENEFPDRQRKRVQIRAEATDV